MLMSEIRDYLLLHQNTMNDQNDTRDNNFTQRNEITLNTCIYN